MRPRTLLAMDAKDVSLLEMCEAQARRMLTRRITMLTVGIGVAVVVVAFSVFLATLLVCAAIWTAARYHEKEKAAKDKGFAALHHLMRRYGYRVPLAEVSLTGAGDHLYVIVPR